ncbi:hypothetical protein CsSME_00047499 [Camellia sinensis var. sinensis]
MDFTLKVVGGELSAILEISDAIEDMIQNAIEDSITWPIRKIIPILPRDYKRDLGKEMKGKCDKELSMHLHELTISNCLSVSL